MQELVRLRMRPSRDKKCFRYMLDYVDRNGKRHQVSLGHADKRKAESQRREKELELRMGRVCPGPMKLTEFLRDCIERTQCQVRPSTLHEMQSAMQDFIQCVGDVDIHHVGHEHGERYMRKCFDSGNAPATVAKKVRHIKRMLQLALDRGQLEDHPLRRIKQPKSPRRKVRVFSEQECQRLIGTIRCYDAENHEAMQWEILVRMGLCTAMRWGELMNTTWMDIDFENKTVEVSPKKDTAHTWEWHIKDTHRRTLPLTNTMVAMLVEHQTRQADGYPYVFLPAERYEHIQARRKQGIWTTEDGRKPACNFHRTFRTILTRAGFQGHFHDLRRTCLSNWLANGLGEFDVMNLAGHSSFQTTHTFYLAVRRDLSDRARAVMEQSEEPNLLRACCAPPVASDPEESRQAQALDGSPLTNRARRDSNPRPTD